MEKSEYPTRRNFGMTAVANVQLAEIIKRRRSNPMLYTPKQCQASSVIRDGLEALHRFEVRREDLVHRVDSTIE